MTTTLRRIKRIRSHAGHARFLAACEPEPIGTVPRQIPTPYASGPTHIVWAWGGTPVVIAETSHKVYDVFRVDGPLGPKEED